MGLSVPPSHKNKRLFLFPFLGFVFFVLFLGNNKTGSEDVEFFHGEKRLREKDDKRPNRIVRPSQEINRARVMRMLQGRAREKRKTNLIPDFNSLGTETRLISILISKMSNLSFEKR